MHHDHGTTSHDFTSSSGVNQHIVFVHTDRQTGFTPESIVKINEKTN